MTRDYKRNGTTTLYAALYVATVHDLIDDWTDHWNEQAAPFTWSKTAEAILVEVRPARAALTRITP
jgi:hypothetical protein